MARIRTIKPEFWTSEQVTECSPNARLLFIGLLNFCDDSGVHPESLKRLKMEVFPSDDFSIVDISEMVSELLSAHLLELYSVADKGYWRVTGWRHQKIDQPTFKHPLPDGEVPSNVRRKDSEDSPKAHLTFAECSPNAHRTVGDHSASVHPRKGKEEEGKEKEKGMGANAPASAEDGLKGAANEETTHVSKLPVALGVRELVAEGVDPQHAKDWLKARKGKYLTQTAWNSTKSEAAKAGLSLAEAIQMAAERSWLGFRAEYVQNSYMKGSSADGSKASQPGGGRKRLGT